MIEVTQADREAYLAMNMLPEFDAADVRAGLWDKVTGLQAFARHRIAAHAEGYAAAKAEGWQPIATAPRDGTTIDVWVGGEFPRRIADVRWRKPTDSEWWVHAGDTIEKPDSTWHDTWGPFGKDSQPTHWMPLPAPPAIERGDFRQQGEG